MTLRVKVPTVGEVLVWGSLLTWEPWLSRGPLGGDGPKQPPMGTHPVGYVK